MMPDERQALLSATLADEGTDPDELLAYVHDQVFTHPMGDGHPSLFGWVNSLPAALGIIADFWRLPSIRVAREGITIGFYQHLR
jgi:hypothetical protein